MIQSTAQNLEPGDSTVLDLSPTAGEPRRDPSATNGRERLSASGRLWVCRLDTAHVAVSWTLPVHPEDETFVGDRSAITANITVGETSPLARDPLTGMASRSVLLDRLRREARPGDSPTAEPRAVLFIDIDGFKEVNDRCGHLVGDEVLRALGAKMLHAVRPGDLVARYGGDEFVVVPRSISAVDDARTIARRLLQVLSEPLSAGGVAWRLSASIGIALQASEPGNAIEVLDQADRAMYRAKTAGGNRIAVAEVDDAAE